MGLGASVYWIDPNNTIIDEYDNSTPESSGWLSVNVISRNETTDDEYQIIAHRTLIINDFIDSLADVVGVYKCVVSDPGYLENSVFEEYSVTLTNIVSSTETPSVSASSSQALSSSLVTTSSSPISSPPLPSSNPIINDDQILILTLSSVFITIVLIVFSLIIATIMYCKHKSMRSYTPAIRKVPPSDTKNGVTTGGGTAGAGSVQVLAKGLMAPTSFMFFPKFDMSEREVSRQHLILIDKLGKREGGRKEERKRERGGEREREREGEREKEEERERGRERERERERERKEERERGREREGERDDYMAWSIIYVQREYFVLIKENCPLAKISLSFHCLLCTTGSVFVWPL